MIPYYIIQQFWDTANASDYDFMRWSDFLSIMTELRNADTDDYDPIKPDPTFGGGTITLSGDVTGSGVDSITATIASGAVTYAKIQNVEANTFLANVTGSAATVQEISTARIPLFSSAITGTASSSTYLRGDGSWASAVADNIYTADGTLSGNRELTHGGYHLSLKGGTYTNRFTSTGRLLMGTVTEGTHLVDVNGSLRGQTRVVGGAFTVGSGVTSDDKLITDGNVRLGGKLNFRSPIYGDAIFTGFEVSTGIDVYKNNIRSAYFDVIGSSSGTSLLTLVGGFNATSGSGNAAGLSVYYDVVPPSGSNSNNYTAVNIIPSYNQQTYGTGTLRGVYYNPTIYSLNTSAHYAFESTSGKIKISDLAGTGTRMVTCDSNGVLGYDTIPSGGVGSTALSALTAATATNTINSGNYKQEWQWNSLTGTGLKLSSSSGGSGTYTSNQLLEIVRYGTNAATGISTYGIMSAVSNTGTNANNFGGYFVANSGTNNYGVFGDGTSVGVYGQSVDGDGVYGSSANPSSGKGVVAVSYINAAGTGYGLHASSGGSKTNNIGGYFTAYGATNNYALVTDGGNVGFGTTTPNAKAIVEMSSTTTGFLPPRMTTTQRTAISSPPTGLVVYDTTDNKLAVYNGTAWKYFAYE